MTGPCEFHTAQPGEPLGNLELRGQETGHEIDLVLVGDGDHHFRVPDSRFYQHARKAGVAVNRHHIQRVRDAADLLSVIVDDRNIVAFPGKFLG